jgi:hypothetical protein
MASPAWISRRPSQAPSAASFVDWIKTQVQTFDVEFIGDYATDTSESILSGSLEASATARWPWLRARVG